MHTSRIHIFQIYFFFFFSSRRRHTRWPRDWSSDVCSSDLKEKMKETKQQIKDLRSKPVSGGIYIGSGALLLLLILLIILRSEERRVGKECRFWWGRGH